jgi:hypothetical protein
VIRELRERNERINEAMANLQGPFIPPGSGGANNPGGVSSSGGAGATTTLHSIIERAQDGVSAPLAAAFAADVLEYRRQARAAVLGAGPLEPDGVALSTAEHPVGPAVAEDAEPSADSIETIEVDVREPVTVQDLEEHDTYEQVAIDNEDAEDEERF